MSIKDKRFTEEFELDLDNLQGDVDNVDFDIDLTPDEDETIQKKEQTTDDTNDEEDSFNLADDLEIEIIDTDEADTEEKEEPEQTDETKGSEEHPEKKSETDEAKAAEEVERKRRSQERILQLDKEKKELLAARLADLEERKKLQERILLLEKSSSGEVLAASEQGLKEAKMNYARAYEEGDAIKIAEATTALQQATFKVEMAKLKKSQADAKSEVETYTDQIEAIKDQLQTQPVFEQDVPKVEEGVEKWFKRNSFVFTNGELNQVSNLLFDQLQQEGYDVSKLDTYTELESRIIAVYPQTEVLFKGKSATKVETPVKKAEAPPVSGTVGKLASLNLTPTKDATKVKYKVTTEDRDMAQRMGIPVALYVKEKLKQEQADRRGSSSVQIL